MFEILVSLLHACPGQKHPVCPRSTPARLARSGSPAGADVACGRWQAAPPPGAPASDPSSASSILEDQNQERWLAGLAASVTPGVLACSLDLACHGGSKCRKRSCDKRLDVSGASVRTFLPWRDVHHGTICLAKQERFPVLFGVSVGRPGCPSPHAHPRGFLQGLLRLQPLLEAQSKKETER